MLPTLDIIIVNWNAGPHLGSCLQSVASASHSGFALGRVVVVDNASRDGSEKMPPVGGLSLTVIRNDVNRGFAAACNQGAKAGVGDYLLLLNPDTELFASSLTDCVAFMENQANCQVGIAGAALVDADGRPGVLGGRFPTVGTFLADALGLSLAWPGRFPGLLVRPPAPRDVEDIDAVMGAFFLIRGALFRRLGGFDERFFVYLEDVDLSWRAREMGFRSVVLGGVRVRHVGGASSQSIPAERLFYALRSRLLYGFKHFTKAGAAALAAVTFFEFAPRMARAAWRLSMVEARSTATAYALLLREMPRLLSSRRMDGPPRGSR
jgi:N-acetylglucosaminyl-diphospho-decaprenol L-rhamnosyltransferase